MIDEEEEKINRMISKMIYAFKQDLERKVYELKGVRVEIIMDFQVIKNA